MDELNLNADSLESIPEALHQYYTPTEDGKFKLAVKGVVEATKLEEFRNNNITLKQERDTFQSQLDELTKKINPTTETSKDTTSIDRLAALENDWKEMKRKLDEKEEQLSRKTKEDQIRNASTELGIPASAHVDVINRVLNQKYKYENDQIIFDSLVDEQGQPYDVKKFIDEKLRADAPHFFIQKTGTGNDPKQKTVIPGYKSDENKPKTVNDMFVEALKSQ